MNNQLATNIDKAEREFAQKIADAAGISIGAAQAVSVFYRMRNVAWLNDRATEIVYGDPSILTPAVINRALRELQERAKG